MSGREFAVDVEDLTAEATVAWSRFQDAHGSPLDRDDVRPYFARAVASAVAHRDAALKEVERLRMVLETMKPNTVVVGTLTPEPGLPGVVAPDYVPGPVDTSDALGQLALEQSRARAALSGTKMTDEDHVFMSRWYRPWLQRACDLMVRQVRRDFVRELIARGVMAGVVHDIEALAVALGLPKDASAEQMQARARELSATVAAVRAALPGEVAP